MFEPDGEADIDARPPPTVSIGLPVYNGEDYLEVAIRGLLDQTFTDFELIISDNGSTDRTAQICQEYAARDPRIRYVRQASNIGAVPNHNVLVPLARGRYFKWVGHDDLYSPELIAKCVEALETRPWVVLANVWDGMVDSYGNLTPTSYELDTDDPRPHRRLRSLLHVDGGNDFYGVIRIEVLRHTKPLGTYLHSDRTFMAQLTLAGPFYEVPEVLFHRRDHPGRASRARTARNVASNLDPHRASRWRHPLVRLYAEYVVGFLAAVLHAPLTWRERVLCLGEVGRWLLGRFTVDSARQLVTGNAPPARVPVRRPDAR